MEEEDYLERSSESYGDFQDDDSREMSKSRRRVRKCFWLETPTKLMLKMARDLSSNIGKTVQLKTKKKMWEVIQRQLYEKGYEFTVAQIESKYWSMDRQYKKIKQRNSLIGVTPKNEMESITPKKENMFAEIMLAASDSSPQENLAIHAAEEHMSHSAQEQLSHTVDVKNIIENTEISEEHYTPEPSTSASVLNELRQSREERQKFHAKVLELMEERASMEKRRLYVLERILEKLS